MGRSRAHWSIDACDHAVYRVIVSAMAQRQPPHLDAQEAGERHRGCIVRTLLTAHKQNDGSRLKPVAIQFDFNESPIGVRQMDPGSVDSSRARCRWPCG